MSAGFRTTRKSSDAENLGLKPKPYRKMNRLTSAHTLRDTSVRRRNRVISGLSVPKFILSNAKRQKVAAPPALGERQMAETPFESLCTLPTPPASPALKSSDNANTSARKVTLSFPSRLERPQSMAFDEEAVRACDPEGLKDVPVAYIRRSLAQLGPHMFQVLAGIRAPPFKSDKGLPKEIVVLAHDLSAQMPTHLLAIFSKPSEPSSPSNRTSMTLYPAHHIVLAAQCAGFPKLQFSAPPPPQQRGGPVVLPVVPIILPHPSSYHAIHQYLYLKDRMRFLMSLLPVIPPQGLLDEEIPAIHQYIKDLALTFTPVKLLSLLRYAHGTYRNLWKLRVEDDAIWHVMTVAWKVLISAFAISVGTVPRFVPTPEN